MSRWSEDQANTWWAKQPWVCGFNYLPSTAVNFLEMWHPDTFHRKIIARELEWASQIGFNAVRFNLHYLVWKNDREGLIDRLSWLIQTAGNFGISSVPCLFDDCGFGGSEPEYGHQPEPLQGVHNSRAVASPGRAMLFDQSEWDGFQAYVQDIIASFRTDENVLFWDLYNEPGNRMIFTEGSFKTYEPDTSEVSLALLMDCFDWARSQDPTQPLSVAVWMTAVPGSGDDHFASEIEKFALNLSDVVTFHSYQGKETLKDVIAKLEQRNRPVLCTEWMARPIGSTILDLLPSFASQNVGCFQWGLVKGRTQTNLPWPSDLVEANGGRADRSVWFHDLIDDRGVPYDPSEVSLIGSLTSATNQQRTATRTT